MAEASAKGVTGYEPQGTMGRVPSRLPLRARFKERRLGTRQARHAVSQIFVSVHCYRACVKLNSGHVPTLLAQQC